MKRKILTTVAIIGTSISAAFSQICPANDSIAMGPDLANDVYYSLKKFRETGNGTVKTVANNNWHLAISVQPSQFPSNPANGVAIRVNSTLGENAQAGLTGTRLVKLNGANPNNWHAVDTTGLYMLPELIDSDSTWNLSAFTKGYPSQGPFNFIWGTYNQNNHNVASNGNVYVLYNKSEGWYKKIHVRELAYDTLWNIILSDIDNTDSVNLTVNKREYPERLFVYYNVRTNTITDREPNVKEWDLVWTKYKSMVDFMGSKIPYSVTGVQHNRGVTTARNTGKPCNLVWLANMSASYQHHISTIGHDWKTFNTSTFKYEISDTLVYFIKGLDSQTYKMTMKSFTGGSAGKTTLNVYQATLGLNDEVTGQAVNLYPNPVTSVLHAASEKPVEALVITDMQGRKVADVAGDQVNVADLSPGLYHITVKTSAGLTRKVFIKQ